MEIRLLGQARSHERAVRRLRHRLQVRAGGEVSGGTGEDRDPHLGLAVDVVEPVGEPHEHVGTEGVARLGPVHREDHDVPVALDAAVLGTQVEQLGHRCTSGSSGAADTRTESNWARFVARITRMRIPHVALADGATCLSGPPHGYCDFLRREHPVAWVDHVEADGPGFWALTRSDDVMAVERDPETFSSYVGGAFIGPVDEGTRLMMINQDPPRHTRLRQLVSRMFTPRHIRSIEANVRAAAKEIVDRVAPKGEIDFVTEVAADLPLIVIAELIGVPQEDRHKVF